MALKAEAFTTRVSYHPQRVNHNRPCQICGRMKYCGFDPIAGVAFCPHTPNDSGRRWGEWGYIHAVDASPEEYSEYAAVHARPDPILTDEDAGSRHVLYSEMAANCRLTAEDFADLTVRRGMDEALVKRLGYFSYPSKDLTKSLVHHLEIFSKTSLAAKRWDKAHPELPLYSALHRLPGHYTVSKKGRWGGYYHALKGERALGIPVRNARGEIIAIRLRVDARHSDNGKKQVKWLSSPLARSGSPIHVARPATITDTRVWITEGEIKADIAAEHFGAVVLSIPGISNWKALPETLDACKAVGFDTKQIVIALDQDAAEETRARVQTQVTGIAKALTSLGYVVSVATWESSDGKGLDDLVMAGHSPTVAPFAAPRMRGLVPMVPVEYGGTSETTDNETAGAQLTNIAKQIFPSAWPRGVKAMETFALMATMGLGKTFQLMTRLDIMDRTAGAWPKVWNSKDRALRDVRVLVLFDDVQILAEQTAKYFSAVWTVDTFDVDGEERKRAVWDRTATARPSFFIMEGRNPAPHSGGYCANPMAGEVSGRRGLPIADVCRIGKDTPCPFHKTCAYLESKKAVKAARIVCACKSAYLTESKELDEFDLVIMDEDTAAAFLEQIDISTQDVDQWRKLLVERDTGHQFAELERFLGWWQEAIAHAKAHGKSQSFEAVPHFRATAPADAKNLLLAARRAATWNDGGKGRAFYRAICEMIWQNDRAVPLRALHDVTGGLLDEWDRHQDADTRLRFSDAGTLNYRHPREELIVRLFTRRVAILDATGDMQLLRRIQHIATSGLAVSVPFTVLRVQVAHQVKLTQITDSLYGRKSLGKDGGVQWHAIEETIGALAGRLGIEAREVARMTYKLFDPNDPTSETAGADAFMTGHYGLDNKATNRFFSDETKCRMLVTIGNYTPNIGEIAATVEAWRFSPDPRTTGSHTAAVNYPGKAQGVERPIHNDPDVQAAILHATWAAETQALGRMRDIRRPDEVIHWVRFNKDPYIPPSDDYQAVKVAALMTHNGLRKQLGLPPLEVFKARQREPLRKENARRQAEAESKCESAAAALAAEGKELTANALATRAHVNYNRAKAWIAAQQTAKEQAQAKASAAAKQAQRKRRVHPSACPPPPAHIKTVGDKVEWMKAHGVDVDDALAYLLPRVPTTTPHYQQEAS